MIGLTLGSSLIGLVIAGTAGVVCGLALGVLGSLVGFKALTLTHTTTIRES